MNLYYYNNRIMIPCTCGNGSPICGNCAECQTSACRECAITYNEQILTHHECMEQRIKRPGIHLLSMGHIFDATIYSQELTASIRDSDYRPRCKKCKISDVPIRLLIWYKSDGFIHPNCINKNDEQFNKWRSMWYEH